jgi:hypothetical protein
MNECSEAFTILSRPHSHDLSVLWVEPIFQLCSTRPAISLPQLVNRVTAEHLWPVIESRLLEMHAYAMLKAHVSYFFEADIWGPDRTSMLPVFLFL